MMLWLRHAARLVGDLLAYAASSGRWWLPVVTLLMTAAGILALTAKAVVPSAVYVLF